MWWLRRSKNKETFNRDLIKGEVRWASPLPFSRSPIAGCANSQSHGALIQPMALEESIKAIVHNLRQGRFPNEQAISQGVVLRVLQELAWDTYDPTRVWPEFQTGEGRVDFALCHPPSMPRIFLEVKQPGRAEDGLRQLFEYAFFKGVPFVVLTDGKTWSFYLPGEQGTFDERRVYKLDLFERSEAEVAAKLIEYLQFSRVVSGEALEAARLQYQSSNKKSLARQTIKAAWEELLENEDPTLIELVSDAVESKCGVRPDDEDVAAFLKRPWQNQQPQQSLAVPQTPKKEPTPQPRAPFQTPPQTRAATVNILGQNHDARNAKEATLIVLRELARRDPSFLARCIGHPDNVGRKRAYIGRNTEDLFPDRPDLRELHEEIADGFLLNTNLSNASKQGVLRMACEVAGLTYGREVRVSF